MKLVALSGIADKENVLIPMNETFDDSRLTKESLARYKKLKAVAKPEEVEADQEEAANANAPRTQKELAKKSVEELVDIANGLGLQVPEKPTVKSLTALILAEDE